MVTVQPRGGAARPVRGLHFTGRPEQKGSATAMSGTPWDALIRFSFSLRAIRQELNFWLPNAYARGVTRTPLESGEVQLTSRKPCEICRLTWEVRDRRDNTLFVESAVGLLEVTAARIAATDESYSLTLHTGDFLLNELGEREYFGGDGP